uniref:Transcription repressor n=1 Tax=Chenopodium quinoa TaxID=63459 RepID=A0A803MXV4_CHEQI
MGKKKMKLPFLFQSKSLDPKTFSSSLSNSSSSQPWPFPSCGNIKTLSFRAKDNDDDAFRTFNSAFLESEMTPPESCFTISSSSRSFSTMSEDSGDPLESVIRGLRSDRLFFEPERSSSLLLHLQDERSQELEPQQLDQQPIINPVSSEDSELVVDYKESEVLSMDSNSPYEDFRRSMEEMVEAHGVKDWQGLEQLLGCYLKINGKNNHGAAAQPRHNHCSSQAGAQPPQQLAAATSQPPSHSGAPGCCPARLSARAELKPCNNYSFSSAPALTDHLPLPLRPFRPPEQPPWLFCHPAAELHLE